MSLERGKEMKGKKCAPKKGANSKRKKNNNTSGY